MNPKAKQQVAEYVDLMTSAERTVRSAAKHEETKSDERDALHRMADALGSAKREGERALTVEQVPTRAADDLWSEMD